jgi:hypothetical protein
MPVVLFKEFEQLTPVDMRLYKLSVLHNTQLEYQELVTLQQGTQQKWLHNPFRILHRQLDHCQQPGIEQLSKAG